MAVEFLPDQGGDKYLRWDGSDELKVFCSVVVAFHEASWQGNIYECA